jgi:lipopolysaccharide/colanic/teichoic acid biosynthesis glycosyltransferase
MIGIRFRRRKAESMDLFRPAVRPEHEQQNLTERVLPAAMRVTSKRTIVAEHAFGSMLYLERRRAERAQKRYLLLLLDVRDVTRDKQNVRTVEKITQTLFETLRETDTVGWYVQDSLVGVIGTELGKASAQEVRDRISAKLGRAFSKVLGLEKASQIFASFHFFPEDKENGDLNDSANMTLYPDLRKISASRVIALSVKRAMDVAGSAFALIALSPLFAVVALAIKVTSRGPVLFGQKRRGQYGKKFTLLKFRSMRTECDSQIHQDYVSRFIAGQVATSDGQGASPVFKIQKDPRVTPVGRLLRKTSLDELPQFWNVLMGEMSLVGPRPPVEYEFTAYDFWHRRRVMEIKPGMTGLWQVKGRSRIKFDDMVRMDLEYARSWSIWLDLKILMQTPAAVVSGDGAH